MVHRKTRHIFQALTALVALFVAVWLLHPFLSSQTLTVFVARAGTWGPVVLIFYVVLSHVVAPLAGIPALLVGAAVFGVPYTMAYVYTAGLISAPINFFISRRFGRVWVRRLTGERAMQKIDLLVASSGIVLLASARIFGTALFEEISYAFGLTSMRFKTFFITTALASAIPHAALGFFFRDTDFSSSYNTVFFLGILLLVSFLFGLFFARTARHHHEQIPTE